MAAEQRSLDSTIAHRQQEAMSASSMSAALQREVMNLQAQVQVECLQHSYAQSVSTNVSAPCFTQFECQHGPFLSYMPKYEMKLTLLE